LRNKPKLGNRQTSRILATQSTVSFNCPMDNENVLKDAVETFAETIKLKVEQLRRFVPKEKAHTNTDLTGRYIEELVRGFIRHWIRDQQLLHGTLYSGDINGTYDRPLQLDGIVYDPSSGPLILQEGDFVIVHPAFCSAVIEIKMTLPNGMDTFETRLREIWNRHFHGVPSYHVMGVVIADKNPEVASRRTHSDGKFDFYYKYFDGGLCPIFVLFKEAEDGQYEPFYPAIDAMIRAIYRNTKIDTNYID